MTVLPKDLTKKYFPNLGDQHVVGLEGVGVSVIEATLACNTAMTDAQLIAGPPNTATHNAHGPIVHSLGIAPTAVVVQAAGVNQSIGQLSYIMVTADNSAIYVHAKTSSMGTPIGVRTRFIAIR
jgi:hypothetical protein